MRVIAGRARGRGLVAPRGCVTRPTADMVREAIFGMIEHLIAVPERVLDLYAGSGALGIEALSRGATWCDFVDASRAACRAIGRNLVATESVGQARVHCARLPAALTRLDGPYELILVDPPYADSGVASTLEATGPLLATGGIVVLERGRGSEPVALPESLAPVRERRYGDTIVTILARPGPS